MPETYLPSIKGNAAVETPLWCGMTRQAKEFAFVWLQRLGVKAYEMQCDPRLVTAAQKQAVWLAVHDFVPGAPHDGENGSTANERVRATSYQLPSWWPVKGNQCESATRSWDVIAEIVDDLMAHDTHADHLWVREFWQHSTVYGVGAAQTYYVLVTAPPERN